MRCGCAEPVLGNGWKKLKRLRNAAVFLLQGVRADEAVADDGASRWDNFYVEANKFLLESPGTDGASLLSDDPESSRQYVTRQNARPFAKKGSGH